MASNLDGVSSSFDDLYDDETRAAIDSWRPGRGAEPVRGWRGGVTAAAVVASGLVGVSTALEDDVEPVIEEPRLRVRPSRPEAVTVLFVPDDPVGTVAVVRPWLLANPGPALLGFSAIPGGVTPPP